MTSIVLQTAILFVGLSGGTYARDISPNFLNISYSGTVHVNAVTKDGTLIASDSGVANAVIELSDENELMVRVTGNINENGDNGLIFQLDADDQGWSRNSGDQHFAITMDGGIIGQEHTAETLTHWTGTISPDGLQLKTRIEFIGSGSSLAHGGDVFSFSYNLAPVPNEAPQENVLSGQEREESDEECTRVEWRLQATPNIWGGAMDMISVPHCVP